jgi:hypothetical protein
MSKSVEWSFTLVDDHQPSPSFQSHPGHVSRGSDNKAGADNHEKIAFL